MTIEELKKENDQLHQKVADLQNDIREIGIGIYKTLIAIGLDMESLKDHKVATKKVIKAVPGIVSDAVIDPDSVEMRFSHLSAFVPLLEKHGHLIEDIINNE